MSQESRPSQNKTAPCRFSSDTLQTCHVFLPGLLLGLIVFIRRSAKLRNWVPLLVEAVPVANEVPIVCTSAMATRGLIACSWADEDDVTLVSIPLSLWWECDASCWGTLRGRGASGAGSLSMGMDSASCFHTRGNLTLCPNTTAPCFGDSNFGLRKPLANSLGNRAGSRTWTWSQACCGSLLSTSLSLT